MVVTISTAIAIYFVLWWITLFLTLPFGVRSQGEQGEIVAGTDPGAPAVPRLLEKLAGFGWGPVQMYFQLTPQDLTALRAGEELTFSEEPKPGERRLPPEVAREIHPYDDFNDFRGVPGHDFLFPVGGIDTRVFPPLHALHGGRI